MRLKTRVLIIIAASLLSLIAMGFFGLYSMRQGMLDERRAQITQLLIFAEAQLKHFHALEVTGKMTRDEAQARAKEALGAQRNNNDYFFIRGLKDEYFVMHPIPSRLGKPDNGGMLPDGRTTVQAYWDALAASDSNIAFIELEAPKPGDADKTKRYPKLNGALKFEPWGWMPGIGFYIDDIDAAFWKQSSLFLAVAGLLFALSAALVFRMRTTILRQLGGEPQDAAYCMKRIASGDLGVDIPLENDNDDSLMASLKLMQMKLTNLTASIQENTVALADQVKGFEGTARAYAEDRSEDQFAKVIQATHRLGKTADILQKSIARLKL
ncbi:MAG: cache domain-containing protein [Pseudomonadota bacterium]